MKIHIQGGTLIDPAAGTERQQDVYLDGGRIVALGAAPAGFRAEKTLDARGLFRQRMGGQGARAGGIQSHQAAAHARLGQVEGQEEIAVAHGLGHQANMAIRQRFSTAPTVMARKCGPPRQGRYDHRN